jgi:hypothetical protein
MGAKIILAQPCLLSILRITKEIYRWCVNGSTADGYVRHEVLAAAGGQQVRRVLGRYLH